MDCPSLLLRGAVVFVMGTILWRWNVKSRRVDSDQIETGQSDPGADVQMDSDQIEAGHSDPGADVAVPDIFLSHFGTEKPFVERLYENLQRTNYTVFFDQEVLPKGSRFPPHIEQAARGCKLGVVVLSEYFLTSRWPMMELELLVRRLASNVLPLFFRLHPEDLKTPSKLRKWRREWKKIGCADRAKQWEEIVRSLQAFNGMVYVQGTSEGEYIRMVVDSICTRLPSHVPYDSSLIQGRSRLAQAIAAKFECLLDPTGARMVGLHGVAGVGKTTLCKVMVNYYSSHYRGRSFLIEFPSPGAGDMSTIILQCKKALQKLTYARDKHLLRGVDHIDQVVQLMRDRVDHYDVFLAVDNVWEDFLEEAKRVLWVGFSAKSKIVVTSRSEEVLKVLFEGFVGNVIVDPLPVLEREEAFDIFQQAFELGKLSDLVDNIEMDEVLGKCQFSSSFHPLALKVLATSMKRVCMSDHSKKEIKHELSRTLKETSFKALSQVDEVIRQSYDSLSELKKRVFLDIVVWLCVFGRKFTVQEWFSMLDLEFDESQLRELSLDGLIQIADGRDREKAPVLHDLYLDFAKRKIASSPRYWVQGITTESVEKVKWEDLEIVSVDDERRSPGLFEKLQQCGCPKLRLLRAVGLETRTGIRVKSMPFLSALILERILVESECRNTTTNSGSHSETDSGSGSRSGSQEIELIGSVKLQKLEAPNIRFVEEIADLDALSKLQYLKVTDCRWLKSLDGLSGLVQLHVLDLARCTSLEKLPDMRRLTRLKTLTLESNDAMEEVGGLPNSLEGVSVNWCKALKRMPDMSSLTRSKTLHLYPNSAMEEVGGLPSSLEGVSVRWCGSSLTGLKTLRLSGNDAMEEVGGLPSSLEEVTVKWCGALKRMPDMSSLTRLKTLILYSNGAMEEVGGLPSNLEKVTIRGCGVLKRMPDVSSLTLKLLDLDSKETREEVGGH